MQHPPIDLLPIDISAYRRGNTGVDYAHRLDSGRPGPCVMINALTHGNELCGAHALRFLFERDIRPRRGTILLSFANVAAYQRFDPRCPGASRYVDEDLNRLWAAEVLDGPRRSTELARARQLRPLVDQADYLLDIHSMQLPSPPLMLCGAAAKGRDLALAVGVPAYIVADEGHAAGRRLRDYGDFARDGSPRTALLVECGQHWQPASVETAIATTLRFLQTVGAIDPDVAARHLPPASPEPQRLIEVSAPCTIESAEFSFVGDYGGLEVIPRAGTVIGYDGGRPVVTPYDDCVLVMPSRRLQKGQTAVRFGRFLG